MIGCDHATQPAIVYFPDFNARGDWQLHFLANDWLPEGYVARVVIDEQNGRSLYGRFQPDTTTGWWVDVSGTTHPNSKGFGFGGNDWGYGWAYDFDCEMSASLLRFAGVMYVSPIGEIGTAPNHFYALRRDST
jgi:hypothetical protein